MKNNIQVIMPETRSIKVNGQEYNMLTRVCAYCRVSTVEEEQMHSIGEQKDEYEKKIKDNPSWKFVGIYADEGISGTDLKHRTQFMMLEMGRLTLFLLNRFLDLEETRWTLSIQLEN